MIEDWRARHPAHFIAQPPPPVAWLVIGGKWGLRVALYVRPNWLHRSMLRWLLGFEVELADD